MITKMKVLHLAVLATLAASLASARAATTAPAAVTNATVLNNISVQLTVFSQANPYLSTNKTGTLITAKSGQSAFTTTTLLEAAAADTGDSFDPATSKLISAKSYMNTNVYTYVTTNGGVVTTNYTDNTNLLADLLRAKIIPIATNVVFTNSTTQLEVIDAANKVYPLTNGHFGFNFTAYAANASEQAVGGMPVTGTEAGTASGIGSLTVNSATNWVFGSASGFGTAAFKSENLQTGKNPLYVDIRSSSSAVAGAGYTGGTYTTNLDGVADILTNATVVVVKGTVTESLWKVLVNQ